MQIMLPSKILSTRPDDVIRFIRNSKYLFVSILTTWVSSTLLYPDWKKALMSSGSTFEGLDTILRLL